MHTFGNESYVLTPMYANAWHIFERRRPPKITLFQLLRSSQQLRLLFLKVRRRFHEVDGFNAVCKALETRNSLVRSAGGSLYIAAFFAYPQHVIHQRSSPGPDLYDLHFICFPLGQPFCIQPYPNQLAEDLTDLWRCHEVALCAELILAGARLPCVVSAFWGCETLSHVRCYRYRTSSLAWELAVVRPIMAKNAPI